jgi:hypothetical protein
MNQPTFDFTTKEDTQEGKVLAMLKTNRIVTNRDFTAAGLSLIARNRVSNLRSKGYVIAQKGTGQGDEWLNNAYRLVWYPGETQDPIVEEALRADGWWVRPEEWKGKKNKVANVWP